MFSKKEGIISSSSEALSESDHDSDGIMGEELKDRPPFQSARYALSNEEDGSEEEEEEEESTLASSTNSSASFSFCNITAPYTEKMIRRKYKGEAIKRARNTPSPREKDAVAETLILGRSYHPVHDYAAIRIDEASLFWFTYRRDFLELCPYSLTSDAGWGCMLRASQMLIAEALRRHMVGRDWRPPRGNIQKRRDTFFSNVLTWFADFPGADCPYSLHNMVACGLRYEKLPGEWYGPSTAAYVLRDLCKLHQKRREQSRRRRKQQTKQNGAVDEDHFIDNCPIPRVVVAQEGCVYRDSVEEIMTEEARKKSKTASSTNNTNKKADAKLFHPLAHTQTPTPKLEWDTSLVLLIPLRLGLKCFNPSYSTPLAQTFRLSQSLGFIGGSPRFAIWFYGASSDGSKLYGLDPHTIQNTPERDRKRHGAVSLSEDYLRSVSCSQQTVMDMHRIDPSLALAFHCRDRADFDCLCRSFKELKEESKGKSPELFSIMDVQPNYHADVSVLAEIMARGDEESEEEASDEEDYVFL